MVAECYAMVRGSAIRVTALDRCGAFEDTVQYVVSRKTAKVTINEVIESQPFEMLRNDEDERRVGFTGKDETIRYTVDIEFLRVDPGLLSLIAGVPLVTNAAGNYVGFDSTSRLLPVAFGLEVWSRLAGEACATGEREYGYTVFPFLKGGILTGFQFANGAVSFNLRGAQTRGAGKWGVGPYDIYGSWQRLIVPVSGNLAWRTFKVAFPPPAETNGPVEFDDEIDGGTAFVTSSDEIDGQDATPDQPWEIDGGWA